MNLVLAHNIGDENHENYSTRSMIYNCPYPIGFDGIYRSVYENQDLLEGKKGIFFIMGDYLGQDNTFDLPHVPKLEKYCTLDEVKEMCEKYDFEIGWHTWSHPDLTTLTRGQIMREITPPFAMKYFAYPYGKFNDLVIDCVKEAGFEMAWSVTQGSQDPNEKDYNYKLYRPYL